MTDAPISSPAVLVLCVAALRSEGATDAGARVYSPGDWPSQQQTLPQIKLRVIREVRTSLGRSGPPEFTTVTTVRILVEAQAFATDDQAGAENAQAYAERLKRQVEVAIVNSYPLFAQVQQLASMRTDYAFNSDGATHIAAAQIDMDFEFFEGVDSFAPIATTDLADAVLTATNYPPAAVDIGLR